MHVVSVLFGRHILIGGPGDRARRIAAMPGGRGREQVDHEWLGASRGAKLAATRAGERSFLREAAR